MEQTFEWPLCARPKIKAERDGWIVAASNGAVFTEIVIAELVHLLPEAAERFGTLLVDLPGDVEHYERMGALVIRVHGGRDEITANGLVVDLSTLEQLIEALEDVVAQGDALVGKVRRGEKAVVEAPAAVAWPAPALPRPRIPLSTGVSSH